jgi:hypothetical protein
MSCEHADSYGCRAGEDGEPCAEYQKAMEEEDRYWRAQWAAASPAERDPERYRADMIEADRGHLLRPEER